MATLAGRVSEDEGVRAAFAEDASGLRMVPDAVARPSSAPEVVEVGNPQSDEATPALLSLHDGSDAHAPSCDDLLRPPALDLVLDRRDELGPIFGRSLFAREHSRGL